MSNIKYQEDGAKRAYNKLFKENQNRYLLADEVGLGKTITSAKVIAELWKAKQNQNIRIGYICGNSALGAQNVEKLKKTIKQIDNKIQIEEKKSERLSLTFLELIGDTPNKQSNNSVIQIYTITPSTTIKVESSGTIKERACAYRLIMGENEDDPLLKEVCLGRADENNNKQLFEKDYFTNLSSVKKEFNDMLKTEWDKHKEKMLIWKDENKKTNKKTHKNTVLDECIERISENIINDEMLNYYALCYFIKIVKASQDNKQNNQPEITNKYEFNLKSLEKDKKKFEEKIDHNFYFKYDPNDNCCINEYKQSIEVSNKIKSQKKQPYIDAIRKALMQSFEFTKYWVISILKYIKVNPGSWTDYILEQLIEKCREDIGNSYDETKISSKKYNNNIIDSIIADTCGKEYIRVARKCMVNLSLKMLNIDLFIADEIQNYSELLYQVNDDSKKNESEMDTIINIILGGGSKSKVIMMSATPFRYHTKLNALENTEKDENADSHINDNDENTEEGSSNAQNYLENKSDIYKEFKNVVTYLKNVFQFDNWEKINKQKAVAVKNSYHYGYKKRIDYQEKMLKDANISRVERYMSGFAPEFKKENIEIEEYALLRKEIDNIPKTQIAQIKNKDIDSGDKLVIYDGNSYIYHSRSEKFYIPPENSNFEFYDDEYYISDENAVFIIDYAYQDCYFAEQCDDKEKLLKKIKTELDKQKVRIDYIKSTPALFSFKGGYKKLDNFKDSNGKNTLSKERIVNWKPIFAEPNDTGNDLIYNARIYSLFHQVFDKENLHKLLFIPPSHISEGHKLMGVYENSYGVSKRLFFTDYNMTPKSLSALLTYEANRRVIYDLNKKMESSDVIYYTPEQKESFEFSVLLQYENNPIKTLNIQSRIIKSLNKYDEEHQDTAPDSSPYKYAKEKGYDTESFCNAYFKYMTSVDSLRVLIAYTDADNLYDAIIQYGNNCCIGDILDEYAEYIANNEEFVKSFGEVVNINFNSVNATVIMDDRISITSLNMKTGFATGNYSDKKDKGAANAFNNKIARFNSPLRPFHFISTSIGNEGFDFHVYCRKIVHWSLEYDPVKFEQREGRINRYQCYANRLQLDQIINEEKIGFKDWKSAFEEIKENSKYKKYHEKSKGLFPDFVIPVQNKDLGLIRECYYYPFSFESSSIDTVLQAVGYYRGLLGQSGNDTFEDDFKEFTQNLNDISECFINLYPLKDFG